MSKSHYNRKSNVPGRGSSGSITLSKIKKERQKLCNKKTLSGSVDSLFPDDDEFYSKAPSHNNPLKNSPALTISSLSETLHTVPLSGDSSSLSSGTTTSSQKISKKLIDMPLLPNKMNVEDITSTNTKGMCNSNSSSSSELRPLANYDSESKQSFSSSDVLELPANKRSNSLTLADACSQIQQLCLLPAQPLSEGLLSSGFGARLSVSMYDLSSTASYGLPMINPDDAKHKSFLFDGLGCLLGPTELDRCLPNRSLSIFIATWNMNGQDPPHTLDDFLLPEVLDSVPDIYVIGTQESGGDRNMWEVLLQATIGPTHVLFTSAMLGILHLTVFLRRDLIWFCSVPEESSYSLRPGTYFKTKGAVAVSFQIFGTRILFINSHLFAHEEKQHLRIQNYKAIINGLDMPRNLPLKAKHKDVTKSFDCVFWLGDMNFRLTANRDYVLERLKHPSRELFQQLMHFDQLTQAKDNKEAFHNFEEAPIFFPPTFKFDVGTNHYDSSSKLRVPSYTDRILFCNEKKIIDCSAYNWCPMFRTSDHKPVFGVFHCKVRPGKDNVPLAAGLFNRDVYLDGLKKRQQYHFPESNRSKCHIQ